MKYFIIILLVFVSCRKIDSLSPEEIAKIDPLSGSYIYPVKRNEQRLFELGFEQYYDTCIVPKDILYHLTNDGLIESCFNYPPYFILFYFDSYQEGFDRIVSKSNVFNELFSRGEISKKLITKYESLEVDSFILSNYTVEGTFTLQYLEILLAQNQLIGKMSGFEKNQLITDILSKYEFRKTILKEEVFSSVLSSLILGRILKSIQYNSFLMAISRDSRLGTFLDKGIYYDTLSTSQIITYSKEYLKNKRK